ncbi:MAG: exodeoxyribonuclease V subunit alpha [Rhodanobacter sp.]
MKTLAPTYHFRRLASSVAPPESWRMLDQTVARWVRVHGGSPLLAQVAGWASHVEAYGDSALPLTDANRHGMSPLSIEERHALTAEPMLAVAGSEDGGGTPFVIDHDHFYLRRNYLHEVAVAQHIRARRTTPPTDVATSAKDIDTLFQGDADEPVQPQRDAVAQVLGKRLFVLTGGPGTGKTTTVLRMLMMLIKHRVEGGQSAPSIRIAAPTGKAAQRLSESLRDGAKRMRGPQPPADRATAASWQPLDATWYPHLEAALGAEASTLHRLLGSRGRHGGFSHHAGNPVPADIVIVDEASMIDLDKLRNLLDALRDDTALILVGDADQLTSVGTGSVLLDLVGAMEAEHAADLVRLSHSFRADQSLLPINEAIRTGDIAAFAVAWSAAGSKAIRRSVATTTDLHRALVSWSATLRTVLQAAGAFDAMAPVDQAHILKALHGLRERQLLCALREGEFGAEAANAVIERQLKGRSELGAEATWYPGRAVMITRNDYTVGLFNGDVGLCLRDENGVLGVWFEATVQAGAPGAEAEDAMADSEVNRRAVCFAPGSLPEHQGAFAVTIHKSQGSEYDHVSVLLPPDAENRILSRQLLYTGVSRAKRSVEIWGSDAAVEAAIATPIVRAGMLRRRLEEPSG